MRKKGKLITNIQLRFVIDDDAGVLHADEGDEKADTRADSFLERTGDGIQQPGTHLGQGKDHEQNTLQQHGRQGKLPGITHAQACPCSRSRHSRNCGQ